MLGFIQGFAYGLFVSCTPWFIAGMINPGLAVPNLHPRRWQVIIRYWLIVPFIAFLLWLTSLWGGFGPSLAGWIAGLVAVPVELFVERRWRARRARRDERRRETERDLEAARRRETLEREEREAGLLVLDPVNPPDGADEIVLALCRAKSRLLAARRPDLTTRADRVFTRYVHVRTLIESKFDRHELTFERATGLVSEVCRNVLDTLDAMASLAQGTAGIDAEFVRRRLEREGSRLSVEEQQALQRRLEIVEDAEKRIRALGAGIEAALTTLDDTAVAVSAIETARPQAAVAAEQALKDLRRFVDKAALYGRES